MPAHRKLLRIDYRSLGIEIGSSGAQLLAVSSGYFGIFLYWAEAVICGQKGQPIGPWMLFDYGDVLRGLFQTAQRFLGHWLHLGQRDRDLRKPTKLFSIAREPP